MRKKTKMNFSERNQMVYTWLFISGILAVILTCILYFVPLPEYFNSSYSSFTLFLALLCLIPAFTFMLFRPNFALEKEEEHHHHAANTIAMSRNAYLFTMIIYFTALITLSSTASRVATFFFVLGTLSFLIAHVLHAISLWKYKQK